MYDFHYLMSPRMYIDILVSFDISSIILREAIPLQQKIIGLNIYYLLKWHGTPHSQSKINSLHASFKSGCILLVFISVTLPFECDWAAKGP